MGLPAIGGAFRALGIAVVFLALAGDLAAQGAGRVTGRVVSAASGSPVASAQVTVAGTGLRAVTDAGGRFSIADVPAGTQSVTAQALGYSAKTVTGVAVAAGRTAELDIALATEALALEGLTVTAAAERGSTGALLSERRRAPGMVDAIGADQISRTPDSDAAAAVRRVPGVSVVDGKYVYVRGLGERYGNTTLNGATLPSPLPDKKAVPLDIIPSSLLESVVTAKTYSPDQPGDYAGGLVQIETRAAPASRLFRVSTGVGLTTGSTFESGLGAGLSPFQVLGFGGSGFALPGGLPRDRRAGLPADAAERERFVGELTEGAWGPTDRDIPVSQSFGAAFGDEVYVGGRPLGLVGSVTYSSGVSQPENRADRFFGNQGSPAPQVDYTGTATSTEATLGTLLSASYRIDDTDRVTATGMYNRLAENQARILSGIYESQGPYLRQTRVQQIANTIANTQLRGTHRFEGMGGLGLDWRLAFSRAERYEPGTRTVIYRAFQESTPFLYFNSTESGLILHQELTDDAWNPAVDLTVPLGLGAGESSVRFGASADVRDRDVYTRRIRLAPNGSVPDAVAALQPAQLFAPANIGTGPEQFGVAEGTFPGDNYDAGQDVYAGYAMVDVEILPRLRLVGGARVEQAKIAVRVTDPVGIGGSDLPPAELDDTDVLPALNLSYALTDRMNLRAAVSRTVARPQFRELAPYLYTDYFGGSSVIGNPRLGRTSIVNSDLRWEWFLGTGSVVAVSGFHKRFDDPIEPVAIVLGTNPALTFTNSDRATLYGAEFEVRTNLGRVLPALENFSVNGNLTLVESSIRSDSALVYDVARPESPLVVPVTSGDRPLFGQSPYVVNLGLTYMRPESGTTATVLWNRFGRRLDAFGGLGLPDIYEEGRTQLDLSVEQPLTSGLSLRFNAARLLGGDVEFVQSFPNGETVRTREYTLGRTFSLSLAWEPGS